MPFISEVPGVTDNHIGVTSEQHILLRLNDMSNKNQALKYLWTLPRTKYPCLLDVAIFYIAA